MDRFSFATATLQPNESYILRCYNIRLYDGDTKTSFQNGELILTSHRLLWFLRGTTQYLALDLSCIVYMEEDKSISYVFSKSKKLNLFLMESTPDRAPGPVATSPYNFIKLGFKDKIDADFVSALNQSLQAKKWEMVSPSHDPRDTRPTIKLRTGIVGIERGLEEKQKATNESISAAFQDLNKLMIMAKEMVGLTKTISEKIRDRQGDISDDETIKFKSYLLSLGIDDPVTRTASNNEIEYFHKLAIQVVEIIEKPLQEVGGLMALTDAYCRVNRARGLELLSPQDFLNACNILQELELPIILRVFDSGVKVLQLASQVDEIVVADTGALLTENAFLTAEDLSRILGIPVILAKERLVTTEKFGKACRDESIEGLRFYPNKFLEMDC